MIPSEPQPEQMMLSLYVGSRAWFFADGALRAALRVAGPSASLTCPTTTQVYARLVDFHPRCFALSPFLTADKRLEKPMTSVATLRTASISGLTVCCDGPPSGWLPGRFLSLTLQLRHISMPVPINQNASSSIVHTIACSCVARVKRRHSSRLAVVHRVSVTNLQPVHQRTTDLDLDLGHRD